MKKKASCRYAVGFLVASKLQRSHPGNLERPSACGFYIMEFILPPAARSSCPVPASGAPQDTGRDTDSRRRQSGSHNYRPTNGWPKVSRCLSCSPTPNTIARYTLLPSPWTKSLQRPQRKMPGSIVGLPHSNRHTGWTASATDQTLSRPHAVSQPISGQLFSPHSTWAAPQMPMSPFWAWQRVSQIGQTTKMADRQISVSVPLRRWDEESLRSAACQDVCLPRSKHAWPAEHPMPSLPVDLHAGGISVSHTISFTRSPLSQARTEPQQDVSESYRYGGQINLHKNDATSRRHRIRCHLRSIVPFRESPCDLATAD